MGDREKDREGQYDKKSCIIYLSPVCVLLVTLIKNNLDDLKINARCTIVRLHLNDLTTQSFRVSEIRVFRVQR